VNVAILGGGPAGCATALALVHEGFSIALIERTSYLNVRVGETLPPEVKAQLRSLGVWDQFMRNAPCACSGIRYAWGRPDVLQSDCIFNPYGTGWHIDRGRFDAMLARMAEKAGIHVFTVASKIACSEDAKGDWEIRITREGKQFDICSKFLIDASGRASALARRSSATRIFYDRLVGVVVFLSTPERNPLGDCTFVEAVEDGWWYSAPLPNSRLVVAYMTDADLNERGSNSSIQCWREQLRKTTHTQSLLNSRALVSGPFIFAANSSRLSRFSGRNWLAVGDAAVAFDPLSSQGVYKALESGIRAGRAIRDYFGGDATALRSYAREMKDSFDRYLLSRNKYYAVERRWPHSTFWLRRSGLVRSGLLAGPGNVH
jgi:2-polyprenyl-6-methoxyphenol hydroxylase-like FAD-dependent oxidoreductase